MSRFNLLEENWIAVMTDDKGSIREVSLIDLFNNAHNYVGLAGDMPIQDFAVLRMLLAVLHTVFSRFDAEGNPYAYIDLDEKYRQLEEVDEDDYEDYKNDLTTTWETLLNAEEFPNIVEEYLLKWKDRFYLFDEKYPFFQATESEMRNNTIKALRGQNPTTTHVRKINRTVSESGNPDNNDRKINIFSPKSENNKDIISEAELVRWLILYQGVVGTADKATYSEYDFTTSKGWLFSIGGVSLSGKNLFETLLLNLALLHPEEKHQFNKQKPSWEYTGLEVINKSLNEIPVNNLAELYTNWSRSLKINTVKENDKAVSFILQAVKLPEINPQNQFLELMTLWRHNHQGKYKKSWTPRKYKTRESFWRSFGILLLPTEGKKQKRPGIIDWLHYISHFKNKYEVTIQAFGMEFDQNPNSREPIEEYYDALNIGDYILIDVAEDGWVPRITAEVKKTKGIIERTLKNFVQEVQTIRNIASNDFTNNLLQEAYYAIDYPFRRWLISLEVQDDKEEKISEWREQLKVLLIEQADKLVETAGPRDYRGYIYPQTDKYVNIAIAYNNFIYWLNQGLELKGGS